MRKAPLSPHLQIYKLPLNALLSITHRITGAILTMAFVLLVIILISLALGENNYNIISPFLYSSIFTVLTYFAVLVLIYHLVNGIRHLLWDRLIGIEKNQRFLSSMIVLGVTFLLFVGWIQLI